jgi:excisionase family DNA binding protein
MPGDARKSRRRSASVIPVLLPASAGMTPAPTARDDAAGACPACGARAGAPLMTVAAAATRYGLTRPFAYRWVRKGVLPVVRVGPTRRIRIPVAAADRICQPVVGHAVAQVRAAGEG